MRGNRGHAIHGARLRHQAMADEQRALAHDFQGRVQQQVEIAVDGTLCRVLDRHDPHVRLCRLDGTKNFVKGRTRHLGHGVPKLLERGLLRKRPLRPEIGDRHAALETATGGHDLRPHRGHCSARKGAGIALLQASNDFSLTLRTQDGAIGMGRMLDLAHFLGRTGTLAQQVENLAVDGVDAIAQRPQLGLQCVIHSGARIPSGSRPRPAHPTAAWRCRWRHACRQRSCVP